MPIDFVADEDKIDFQPEEPEFQAGLVGPKERRFSMYDVPALADKLSESPLPTYGMDVPTESVPVALSKTVAGLGEGVVSPLGAAATAAAPIEAAAPALRAGFGALGTKGVYDIALEQITRPEARPKTIPEAVELAGKVVPQLAMAAAPFIPEVTAAAYKNPKTGEVTAGSFHKEAAAEQDVKAPEAKEARETPDYGFIVQDPKTGATEFKTRPETEPIAQASGQLVQEPERPGQPHSDDIAAPGTDTPIAETKLPEKVRQEPLSPEAQAEEQARLAAELGEPELTDEQLWQKAQRKEKLTPEEQSRLDDIEARGEDMGEAETTALQAEADALKQVPPAAPTGEAQPTVPAAGKAEGGVSAPPAPAIPERTISQTKEQAVGEELKSLRKADVKSDPRLDMPGITRKVKPNSLVIQLRDLDSNPIKDIVVESSGDPVADSKTAGRILRENQKLLGRASLRESLAVSTGPNGRAIYKFDTHPNGMTWAKAQDWIDLVESRNKPQPAVVEEPKQIGPPTLTPAESTRLKSLTDKLESGKPLTSAEQKRYRALSDKMGGSAPEEKAAVKAEVEVQKVAATEGQRPAKDVKSELVARLEDSVKKAKSYPDLSKFTNPEQAKKEIGTVTIDIPGDGVFTVLNSKEALGTVLERAKRISTKPTEPAKIKYSGTSKEDRAWIEAQKAQQPPTTPPYTGEGMAGPGSPSITQPPDPKAQIQQLTDAFKNIEGRKVSTQEKLADAFKLGERLSGVKDRLSQSISGLKTAGNYLIGKWKQVQNIDDLLRAKGELSASKETRGWQVRKWVQQAKQATPSLRDQAAISKYIEAGGDPAQLRRGMAETKPRFKQAYQDALNLSPDLKVAAQNISNYFDSRLQEAIDAGVLKEGIEDYIHRIYESKPALGKQAFARVQDGILQRNPGLTKKRLFESDWEAEKAGFIPVQSYIDRIADYESSLSRAIAAREFIKKATEMTASDGRPIVDIKGVGVPIDSPEGVREATLIKPKYDPAYANTPGTPKFRGDYVDREYPALSRWKWVAQDSDGKPIFVQGDVAIHPDYVKRIDALLEPSRVRYGRYGSVARPALAVSSAVKQTMLDLSGFHQVQVTVHGMEHRVMPWKIVKDIDFQNPNVEGLLKGGITLGGDYRLQREGLVGSSLSRHIPLLGPVLESYHNWLFQDYIPRLKMTMALHALERNKARYAGLKTPEEIYNLTASEANAAFGEQNYIMLERSKTAQDMARLILLAPDFLEARGRFAGQALTRGGKAFGNEQRTALLLGALTMWVTARLMNKALDGQPHNEPENLFSVVYKGKAYGLRTVQGDILHLLEKPMQFWMHRLNPVFSRTAMEAITGRDEFGRKRSFSQQVWDGVSTMMPIALRSSREKSLWESLANSFGITARRWSDVDDAFTLAKQWKEKHGITEPGEFIYDRDKDPLRGLKIALSQSDEGAATKEIKKLLESKQTTFPKLQQHFVRYARMPFTGSMGNDVKWKKTLTADQSKTVEAAMEHKRDMLKLFYQAARKYNEAKNTPP